MNNETNCIVFGASGYAGAELARLIHQHPQFSLAALFVSEQSKDADKSFSELYPQHLGQIDLPLVAGTQIAIQTQIDQLAALGQVIIFLATPHEFSQEIAPGLCQTNVTVLDLSGGFRLQDASLYDTYYGFEHKYAELLPTIPYGLPEWHSAQLQDAQLISLPGCYPTASQLALIPLANAELIASTPVINAISGVSGAGRKANLATSYCELSLKPYNLFCHRHLPEIIQGVGKKVIFTPHVADFERGILATITLTVKPGTTSADIEQIFNQAYQDKPLVRLVNTPPTIKNVAHTPYCDIFWQLDGEDLIVVSAIDNLLKGASSQAIQVANISQGLAEETGLIASSKVSKGADHE